MAKSHKEWARVFVDLVKKHLNKNLVSAVIYGSVARGTESKNSDIDLLFVINNLLPGRYQRQSILNPVYADWDQITKNQNPPFISPLLKTPEEAKKLSPVYFDMVDRRIFLVDENEFLKTILADVGERLKKLGATRKKVGRIEYWDLKPNYKPGEIFEI